MVLLWMSNPQQLSFTTSMLSSQPGRISNAATARISFACSPFRAATMCCASDSVRGHTHARALAAPELSGLWDRPGNTYFHPALWRQAPCTLVPQPALPEVPGERACQVAPGTLP